MWRRLFLILAVLTTFALSPSIAATAQDAPAMDLTGVEGLQSAYGRMYFQRPEVTPVAGPEMPGRPLFGMTMILTFDSVGSAESGFETLDDRFSEGFFRPSRSDVERVEVDTAGDDAVEFTDEFKLDVAPAEPSSIVMARDGVTILISVMIVGPETSEWAHAFIGYMVDADIDRDEISFNEDGTSTGGVFERMPGADDVEILGGMIPYLDLDLLANADPVALEAAQPVHMPGLEPIGDFLR